MCICAYVLMCLCAYVLMCLCAYVLMCLCAYVLMCLCANILLRYLKSQMSQNLDIFSSAILKRRNVQQNIQKKPSSKFVFLSREKEVKS